MITEKELIPLSPMEQYYNADGWPAEHEKVTCNHCGLRLYELELSRHVSSGYDLCADCLDVFIKADIQQAADDAEYDREVANAKRIYGDNAELFGDYIIHEDMYWPRRWAYTHKEYDGPEDNRLGGPLPTIEDCKREIIEYIQEYEVPELKKEPVSMLPMFKGLFTPDASHLVKYL